MGTARGESERAGGSHEHRTRGAPGRPEGPDKPKAPGAGRARPDAGHPLQSHRPAAPRVRTTAPAALDGTGAGGQGGRRARPARRRGNAILPLEPPGQWGLREGALATQEFRGRGAGSLADGASARARKRSGRPRPPHPVVACARRPLVRRPARPRDPLGVGPEGDAVPARSPARPPLPPPTLAVHPLDSSPAAQGDSDTVTELLATRLVLVFLGLRRSDRGVLTSRGGLAPPPLGPAPPMGAAGFP